MCLTVCVAKVVMFVIVCCIKLMSNVAFLIRLAISILFV